jgi:rhodanese-related sulfurtransferase
MRIPKLFALVILLGFAGCVGQEKKKGIVVINVLDKEYFDDCHIKGSMHVPYEEVVAYVQRNVDKEQATVVVYCSNYMCTASGAAAEELKALGFDVFAYEAGIAEWYQMGLPVEGSCKKPYLLKKVMHPELEERKDISIISTEDLARKMNFAS